MVKTHNTTNSQHKTHVMNTLIGGHSRCIGLTNMRQLFGSIFANEHSFIEHLVQNLSMLHALVCNKQQKVPSTVGSCPFTMPTDRDDMA